MDAAGNSNGNANALAALANPPGAQGTINGMSYTQYFASIAAAVGTKNATATTNQTTQQQVTTQAQTLRDSISGVSLDGQASQLLQFQQAYESVARVLTIVNSLADSIIDLVPQDYKKAYGSERQQYHTTISEQSRSHTKSQMTKAQTEVSSGLQVQQASDNPGAIGRIFEDQTQIAMNQQVQTNLGAAHRTELSAADTALQSAISAVQSAISLAAEGASTSRRPLRTGPISPLRSGMQQTLVSLSQTSCQRALHLQRRSGHAALLCAGSDRSRKGSGSS